MTPDHLAQRAKDLDAAYAGIVIPDLALEDLRVSAFYLRTTVERDPGGTVDTAATLRNEGARAFLVGLEQRIARARSRTDDTLTRAVSETAETS